jgi:Sigma-70, region 4
MPLMAPVEPPDAGSIPAHPRTLDVLAILAEVGDAGELASLVARRFALPEQPQRRNAQVNTLLATLAKSGRVKRSDEREPSPVYNNVPVYRWWITSAGVEYLRAGGQDGVRSQRREAQEYRAALDAQRRATHQRIFNAAAVLVANLPPDCITARRRLMQGLYQRGLTLAEIGAAFGVTGERARQIINGIKAEKQCRCSTCGKETDE